MHNIISGSLMVVVHTMYDNTCIYSSYSLVSFEYRLASYICTLNLILHIFINSLIGKKTSHLSPRIGEVSYNRASAITASCHNSLNILLTSILCSHASSLSNGTFKYCSVYNYIDDH